MAGPTPTTCLSVWDAGKAPAPHQKLSGAECYKRVRQKSLHDSPCSECLLDLARSTQFVWGFRLMVAGKEVPGPHPPGLVSGWDRHSGGCAHGGQGQTGVAGRGGWAGRDMACVLGWRKQEGPALETLLGSPGAGHLHGTRGPPPSPVFLSLTQPRPVTPSCSPAGLSMSSWRACPI